MSAATSPPPSPALLEIRDIAAGYGAAAVLRGVSLTLRPGEAVGLVGANGAGKSTLLRTIIGLHPAASGGVRFDGVALDGMATEARARRGIGYVPEGRRVFAGLTVRENLQAASFQPAAARARDVDRAFALFPQLAAKAAEAAWRLSGGQQQMLAVARALMGRPRLLLLDEPTLGLAPAAAAEVAAKIAETARDGVAALIAEQSVARLPAVATRAVVLAGGRIVCDGGVADAEAALLRAFAG